jgi:CheY-like chemotaxis protein
MFELLDDPQPSAQAPQRKQTILIVDDDTPQADVLSRRLQQQGFDTALAATGAEGLVTAHQRQPSLVLLDLRLPDTDGWAVCEKLADASSTCHIPVIMLSAMERPDIIRRSRAAGCQYFVRKPYDPNALLILIRHAIQEANSWEAL